MNRRVAAPLLAVLLVAAGCSKSKPDCKGDAVVCGEACVSTLSDNLNCGACGNACGASASCYLGSCEPFCAAGQIACGGSCIDPATDSTHCGASGTCVGATAGATCSAGNWCVASACTNNLFVSLATFQNASLAIGQPDLTTVNAPSCTADSLDGPYGAPAWDGTQLYVSDTSGNRVHVFTGLPTGSGPAPAFDLGQADCALASDPTSATELFWPQSISVVDPGLSAKLVVTDSINNRVLVFSPIPTAAPAAASVAVGQPELTTFATACDWGSLDDPQSAFVTPDGKLIVADQNNNRILIWNALPTANGAPANLVLGQATMTSCLANDDPNAPLLGDVTGSTLYHPTDVWSDGTRLVVADAGNNRVLVWKAFPTANGQPADAVIGQGDFGTNTAGTTASTLSLPLAVASDGLQLFVADAGNNRVLVFSTIPLTGTGALATVVLGQGDFTHAAANDADQDGLEDAGPSAKTLKIPAGLAVINGDLFVTDSGNNRVLIFGP